MTINIQNSQHIHFIGVGGAGMCGIAEVLLNQGYSVSGSDLVETDVTTCLREKGAVVSIGHRAEQLQQAELVVISTAILFDNPELVAATIKGLPILKRAEMLAHLMQLQAGIAIAGTHGKTTTTSLVASILVAAGMDPTFVIGGLLKSAGVNAQLGKGTYLVAEADESDASFLYLQPQLAVVTNIEADHLEAYENQFERLKAGFGTFLHQLPADGLAVLGVDDPVVAELLPTIERPFRTYGFKTASVKPDYMIVDFEQQGNQSYFNVQKPQGDCVPITLNLIGRHNAQNAVAAFAIADYLEVPTAIIQLALLNFQGVGRRLQKHGEYSVNGHAVTLFDDYGHHPREIEVTLAGLREAWPDRRIVLVYQPHRYTRTRDLFDDFVDILNVPEVVVLVDVYSAGEHEIDGARGRDLFQALKIARGNNATSFAEQLSEIEAQLTHQLQANDIVLIQGAGSVSQVADQFAATWQLHTDIASER